MAYILHLKTCWSPGRGVKLLIEGLDKLDTCFHNANAAGAEEMKTRTQLAYIIVSCQGKTWGSKNSRRKGCRSTRHAESQLSAHLVGLGTVRTVLYQKIAHWIWTRKKISTSSSSPLGWSKCIWLPSTGARIKTQRQDVISQQHICHQPTFPTDHQPFQTWFRNIASCIV